ncbi:MAG TPA: hypothetical protein VMV94_09075 [Phycisphaerae bacterium]|nr:hypothetical protein [Phycisphaerae bacterium]
MRRSESGWPTREQLAELVCNTVHRNLTGEEWDRFVGADIPYQFHPGM